MVKDSLRKTFTETLDAKGVQIMNKRMFFKLSAVLWRSLSGTTI